MNNDMVVPGVGVGGVMEKYEIKILICYLLDSVHTPLTREQLNLIFQDDAYVNYFWFCDTLQDLIESEHIRVEEKDGEETFVLLPLGKETAKRLNRNLPKSLRDNVVESAMRILARLKKERENEATIEPYGNGFWVHCIVHDVDFDLMHIKVYAPDEAQAEMIQKRFMEDPSKVYSGLMHILLDDTPVS